MKKYIKIIALPMLLFVSLNAYSTKIGVFYLAGDSAKQVEVQSLKHDRVYAVSCVGYRSKKQIILDDIDRLYLHVNPGEVTDRRGNHSVTPDYEFSKPAGIASFYAQPDNSGTIDFSIVNTLPWKYSVACNINWQS